MRAMIWLARALVFLVACGGGASPPPPRPVAPVAIRNSEAQPAAVPRVDDPQMFCDQAVAAIERWRACDPSSAHAESDAAYDSFTRWKERDLIAQRPEPRRSWEAGKVGMHCAQFIVRVSTLDDNERCKNVDATQSRAASRYLDQFYRDRIAISPTGDAASDAKLHELEAIRERACACKDQPCAEAIERDIDPATMLPTSGPESARQLANLVLSEIHWRCVDDGHFHSSGR